MNINNHNSLQDVKKGYLMMMKNKKLVRRKNSNKYQLYLKDR